MQYNWGGTCACRVEDSPTDPHQQSYKDKYNMSPCYREHETHREIQSYESPQECEGQHQPNMSIPVWHIDHQCNKHKNTSRDDKCSIAIVMLNTKYARITLERMWYNDIILDRISAKWILIFHLELYTWYETILLIKDQPNINIKLNWCQQILR